jgi:hypothetical protein
MSRFLTSLPRIYAGDGPDHYGPFTFGGQYTPDGERIFVAGPGGHVRLKESLARKRFPPTAAGLDTRSLPSRDATTNPFTTRQRFDHLKLEEIDAAVRHHAAALIGLCGDAGREDLARPAVEFMPTLVELQRVLTASGSPAPVHTPASPASTGPEPHPLSFEGCARSAAKLADGLRPINQAVRTFADSFWRERDRQQRERTARQPA